MQLTSVLLVLFAATAMTQAHWRPHSHHHSCAVNHLYCGSRLNKKKYTNKDIFQGLKRVHRPYPANLTEDDLPNTLFECNHSVENCFTFIHLCKKCVSTKKHHSDYCADNVDVDVDHDDDDDSDSDDEGDTGVIEADDAYNVTGAFEVDEPVNVTENGGRR